jgi:general secretion pathway protein K
MADTVTTDRRSGSTTTESGFALIPVIAVVGLLGLVAAGFSASVRSHLQITSNAIRNAQAQVLADGGLELAVLDLLSRADRGDRLAGLRTRSTCVTPDGARIGIEIADEAGKIDLNAAKPEVVEALVATLSEPPASADAVAAAILDYRDPDQDRRRSGAEAADYRTRGRHAGPANAPFASVEEIGSVLDVSADIARRLTPWLTIASGQEGIDPAAADPALIARLEAGATANVTTAFETSSGLSSTGRIGLPARLLAASAGRAFGVRVTVVTESTAIAAAAGVVELAPARRGSASIARIKSWRRVADVDREVGRATASPPVTCGPS